MKLLTEKTIVVLGMHRSATSLVSKGLANEINMGAKYVPISDQPSGNWENPHFIDLNMKILATAGGSWDNPPSRESILNTKDLFKTHIEKLVNRYNKRNKFWGWKDPRTCLTIELYEPFLINPIYICNFRKPVDVAKSLEARNGFSIDKGLWLADIYNDRIIDFITKRHL